jgi:hypothetical protein
MDPRERVNDLNEAVRIALDARQAGMHTSQPGVVVSVDPVKQTMAVQPATKALVRKPDGSSEYVNLPVIPDVPVMFPHGGGFSMTWPIKPGDEVLLMHTSRSIDSWYQSGGVQQPFDLRMHDLTDCFAMLGARSQANKLAGAHAENFQIRSDDGSFVLEFAAGAINIIAGSGVVNITAPTVTVTGNLNVSGEVTAGAGGSGAVKLRTHKHAGGPPPDPGT